MLGDVPDVVQAGQRVGERMRACPVKQQAVEKRGCGPVGDCFQQLPVMGAESVCVWMVQVDRSQHLALMNNRDNQRGLQRGPLGGLGRDQQQVIGIIAAEITRAVPRNGQRGSTQGLRAAENRTVIPPALSSSASDS